MAQSLLYYHNMTGPRTLEIWYPTHLQGQRESKSKQHAAQSLLRTLGLAQTLLNLTSSRHTRPDMRTFMSHESRSRSACKSGLDCLSRLYEDVRFASIHSTLIVVKTTQCWRLSLPVRTFHAAAHTRGCCCQILTDPARHMRKIGSAMQ